MVRHADTVTGWHRVDVYLWRHDSGQMSVDLNIRVLLLYQFHIIHNRNDVRYERHNQNSDIPQLVYGQTAARLFFLSILKFFIYTQQ